MMHPKKPGTPPILQQSARRVVPGKASDSPQPSARPKPFLSALKVATSGSKPVSARLGPGAVRSRPASAGPTLSAAEALAKISPARRVAFEILLLVAQGKGHSDELLHSERTAALSEADRSLSTALVMGVLRWQIALDARIRRLLQRPDQRLAAPVELALRLGAFQLLHMDRIPAHAALSESVELCRAAGEPHATGMVNAILRKIAAAQPPGQRLHESPAAFAERLGHPLWLVERWVATYGREAALAICEAGQRESSQRQQIVPESSERETAALALFADSSDELPILDDGSRLVAELAAAAHPYANRVWDCCAAPGGKTLLLAHRFAALRSRISETSNLSTTALPATDIFATDILATDISARRLGRMESRLRRYSYAQKVRCQVEDVTAPGLTATETFDLILCDVPCSGTGTLSSNPEIRHRLQPRDLAVQAIRQRLILTRALSRLAPGGHLIYATCSLEPEENEAVVATVLSSSSIPSELPGTYRQLPVDKLLANLVDEGILYNASAFASATRNGALRTIPGVHACDGFFAVVLERTA